MPRSKPHVSQSNRLNAEKKIELKIQGLERYVQDRQADFEIPKKFTLNWFCTLSSAPYQSFAKSSEQLRKGTGMHARVSGALARAQEALEGYKVSRGVCEKTERIKALEARARKAEALIPGLTQSIVNLLGEIEELEKDIGVERARWADRKHNVRRIN